MIQQRTCAKPLLLIIVSLNITATAAWSEPFSDHTPIENSIPEVTGTNRAIAAAPGSKASLSNEAQELLRELDLVPLLEQIADLKERFSLIEKPKTIEDVTLRQDLLDCKRELARRILKTNLEVDYVLAAIDGELNHYAERLTELAIKRDKAVLRTTLLAQMSNGLLWAGSSSFTIASTWNPKLSIPDGVLGILGGTVPSALSIHALHQMRGSKLDSHVRPNILSPIFGRATSSTEFFPKSVVTYLDRVSLESKDGKTRKEQLIHHWRSLKYLESDKSDADRLVGLITETEAHKRAVTISLLEKRQKMLNDLRTEVFKMKRYLLELIQLTE